MLVLLLLALVAFPLPVSAHTGESSRLFPARSEVLLSTPQSFLLPAPGADAPPQVVLRSLVTGETFPAAEPARLVRGDAVWSPPTLPSGTYHLSWEYAVDGYLHVEQSFFSVDRPSHQVRLQALLPASGWLAAAAGLLLVFAVAFPRIMLLPAAAGLLLPLAGVPVPGSRWAALLPLLAAAAPLLPRLSRFRAAAAAVAAGLLLFPPLSLLQAAAAAVAALVLLAALSLLDDGSSRPRPAAAAAVALPLLLFLRFGTGLIGFPQALMLLPALLLPLLHLLAMLRGIRGRLPRWARPVGLATLLATVALAYIPAAPTATSLEQVASSPATCLAERDALAVQRCLELAYTEQVFSSGVRPALDDLAGLVRRTPSARFYCHAASHAVGRAAFSLEGSVPDAFASGFDVCDFGFFHGIVEASAAGMGNEEFAEMVGEVCIPLLDESQLLFLQCNHGLGHAAARRSNNDMVRGLQFCETLRTSSMPEQLRDAALNGCGTGVTMEWFNVASIVPDPSSVLSPAVASPKDVCFEVPSAWQPECFEYVGNTVESSRPLESLLSLASWCSSTPYPDACATGLARAASGLAVPPLQVLQVCETVSEEVTDGCVRSFLVFSATTVQFDPDWVNSACALLPDRFRSGPSSVCRSAYEASLDLLEQSGTRLG